MRALQKIFAVAVLALAVSSETAAAQGFEMFGKGIELWGGTVRRNEDHHKNDIVKNDSFAAPSARITRLGNFLIMPASDAQSCRVNGVPTPLGFVWSASGQHTSDIRCDRMRVDDREIELQMTCRFETRTARSSGVLSLTGNGTCATNATLFESRQQTEFRHGVEFEVSIKLHVQKGGCQVLQRGHKHVSRLIYSGADDVALTTTETLTSGPPFVCRVVN